MFAALFLFRLFHCMDIIEIHHGIYRCFTDCVAIDCKMLYMCLVKGSMIFALEKAEWQFDQLRLGLLCNIRKVDFEIFAVAVELGNELLSLAIRCNPKLNAAAA